VHVHGSRYLPNDLIARATGAALDSRHYLDYLQGKYGALYHLA